MTDRELLEIAASLLVGMLMTTHDYAPNSPRSRRSAELRYYGEFAR